MLDKCNKGSIVLQTGNFGFLREVFYYSTKFKSQGTLLFSCLFWCTRSFLAVDMKDLILNIQVFLVLNVLLCAIISLFSFIHLIIASGIIGSRHSKECGWLAYFILEYPRINKAWIAAKVRVMLK